MITHLYLVHHAHTDIGYTDLPSTTWRLHVEYIRQAMALARQTARFPEPARFRWTCEVAAPVLAFLEQAGARERREFEGLVRQGQIEIGAMPWNIQPHYSRAEWQAVLERLSPLHRRYKPAVAMQNDINGLPWGMLPGLRKAGVKYVWMGMNSYSGGSPRKPPAAFWWEGPDGKRVLAFINRAYCDGYAMFHDREWRVGPVPAAHDPWFNAPEGRQTFDDSPAGLKAAHGRLMERLGKLLADYPYAVLPAQVTNMFRMDNDPPCGQLSRFVRAWNAAGLQPVLHLATPGMFMGWLAKTARGLPVLRGDWPDWWADGAASLPLEVATAQRAKQLLADVPGGARALGVKAAAGGLAEAWATASLFDEHTFGAFESVCAPYSPRAMGCLGQKADLAYRAHEEAHALQKQVVTAAKAFCPSSRTRRLTVLNPGATARSGWANIPAAAVRQKANAVRDLKTGQLLPLETIVGQTWMGATERADLPFEVPQDCGAFLPETLRFFVGDVPAGARREFELVEAELPAAKAVGALGRNGEFRWRWNEPTGTLLKLTDVRTRTELLGAPAVRRRGGRGEATYALGDVIIERPLGFGMRDRLARHNLPAYFDDIVRRVATVTSWRAIGSHYGARYLLELDDPTCHHLRQRWDFLPGRRIEITTTLWLKECTAPQAIYIAFPFGLKGVQATYESLGYPTRVGEDQLPESCGEYVAVNAGVVFAGPKATLALATPDTPLGVFGALATRTGRRAFVPTNAHYFALVSHNYWATNFAITRPTKVILRHVVTIGEAGETGMLEKSVGELWVFPSRG